MSLKNRGHRTIASPGMVLLAAVIVAGSILGWSRALESPWLRDLLPPRLERAVVGFAWPEYPYRRVVEDKRSLLDLQQALSKPGFPDGTPETISGYWNLALDYKGGERRNLSLSRDGGQILDQGAGKLLAARGLWEALKPVIDELEKETFGELIPWPDGKSLLPAGEKARVRDIETGLEFMIRRYGGSLHFDVEPLTAGDTAVLRRIFGGEWSWNRRAVVLLVGERRLAASMNGQPHGWGRLSDNDFPGHFCIHLYRSQVHKSRRVNEGHQLMIMKAAGKLHEVLDKADPVQLALQVLAAINYQERATLRQALDNRLPEPAYFGISRIQHLFTGPLKAEQQGDREATVRAQITAYLKDPGKPGRILTTELLIRMNRSSPGMPWRILPESLSPLTDP